MKSFIVKKYESCEKMQRRSLFLEFMQKIIQFLYAVFFLLFLFDCDGAQAISISLCWFILFEKEQKMKK